MAFILKKVSRLALKMHDHVFSFKSFCFGMKAENLAAFKMVQKPMRKCNHIFHRPFSHIQLNFSVIIEGSSFFSLFLSHFIAYSHCWYFSFSLSLFLSLFYVICLSLSIGLFLLSLFSVQSLYFSLLVTYLPFSIFTYLLKFFLSLSFSLSTSLSTYLFYLSLFVNV